MRASLSQDVGPYLPSLSVVDPLDPTYVPFQRVTLERLDTAPLYVAADTEIPTGKRQVIRCAAKSYSAAIVLLLRPPRTWNYSIPSSNIPATNKLLGGEVVQWQTLPSCDRFHLDAIEDAAEFAQPGTIQIPQKRMFVKPPVQLQLSEPGYPNMDLCKAVVCLHMTLSTNSQNHPLSRPMVAQIFLLERSSSCLHDQVAEEYRRIHDHCRSDKLKDEEKRRLLDYCQTTTNRAQHLNLKNREMLQDLIRHCRAEPKDLQQRIGHLLDQLRALSQQLEEKIHQTKNFVDSQLSHITHDQQALLMHNQITLSEIQIQGSRKAIEQTENVRKLTMLAFIFIPTSTICSFFGMNIKEPDNHPKVWIFLVTLIVALATILTIAAGRHLMIVATRFFAALPVLRKVGGPERPLLYMITAFVVHFPFFFIHAPFAMLYHTCRSICPQLQGAQERSERVP